MSASPSATPTHDPSVASIEELLDSVYESHVPDDWEDEDEDDDDIDFEPAVEDIEEDSDADGENEYEDASEDLSGIDIEFALEGDEEEEEEEEGNTENETGAARPVYVTREQIMRLLGHRGLRRILSAHGGGRLFTEDVSISMSGDGVQQDEDLYRIDRHARGWTNERVEFEKVPSDVGRALMTSGTFGANERPADSIDRKKKLASRLLRRELGLGSTGRQRARSGLLKQDLIPSSNADTIIHYDQRCYSGQFSNDGNFFFSCSQDFKVRMYDTSNPYSWKYYKVVDNPYGQWTITDASLSPDNKFLAYSSISKMVCLAPTDPADNSTPRTLDFSRMGPGSGSRRNRGYQHFGIWSIRFSGDGREIVAGTGDDSVYVFDIERNMSVLRIPGHDADVNAVCFGDPNSPHIIYSGSDDTTLKVWDRRSMGDGRAAGVFLGHTEGLTYVDSKGDGRYIISNGKDQTAKLWDLRKVIATEDADKINVTRYTTHFEYRSNAFNFEDWRPHPHDCSLVTFRGHQVLRTLIRCHFSPSGSTDSRYVYSGSYDGKVYIWNLDGTIQNVIDVGQATQHLKTRERRDYQDGFWGGSGYHTCVRDASWHPDVPMIAATSWNGWGSSMGTCTVHSWNDGVDEDEAEPKSGLRVNAKLVPEREPDPVDTATGWFARRTRPGRLARA